MLNFIYLRGAYDGLGVRFVFDRGFFLDSPEKWYVDILSVYVIPEMKSMNEIVCHWYVLKRTTIHLIAPGLDGWVSIIYYSYSWHSHVGPGQSWFIFSRCRQFEGGGIFCPPMEEENVELIKNVYSVRDRCLKGWDFLRKLSREPSVIHEDAVLYTQVDGKARAVLWPPKPVGEGKNTGRTGIL